MSRETEVYLAASQPTYIPYSKYQWLSNISLILKEFQERDTI